MQIKRYLDDREVLVGDRLFDAQGRSYAYDRAYVSSTLSPIGGFCSQ